MPMPINNLDEYEKVVNVSWYTPDKSTNELRYIRKYSSQNLGRTDTHQISMCSTFLADVPALLHRHTEFLEPVLFFL